MSVVVLYVEPPVKVIVGVSVGGVALVIIVILLAIIIMNRKKITSQRSRY